MTNEMQMDTAPNQPAISNALICQHDLKGIYQKNNLTKFSNGKIKKKR